MKRSLRLLGSYFFLGFLFAQEIEPLSTPEPLVQDATLEIKSSRRWTLTAGYEVGFSDYTEDGNILPIESSWSGWNSKVTLKVETQVWEIFPYTRLRIMNSQEAVEEWTRRGNIFQNNDMKIAGGDLSLGFETRPIDLPFATLSPQIGLMARYLNFERRNFVFIDGADAFFGQAETVTEFVQTYGAGGGFSLDMPLSTTWEFSITTEVYGLFFSNADNDAFDASIEAERGLFWDATFSVSRSLGKPIYRVGARINTHYQWIEGGRIGSDFEQGITEWPESRLRTIGMELFWQGVF